MRAYEQFACLVRDAGVRTVFGVLGDGNMHWVAAYRSLAGTAWRPAWHEAGAAWMADGYATRTGDVGVATVTMGPGLAQALPAVMTAVRAGKALIVITAALPDVQPSQAQFADQQAMVRAAGANYVAVHEAGGLAAGLAAALRSARNRLPAVLAVDLAIFETGQEAAQRPVDAAPAKAGLDEAAIDDAVAALSTARAPIVLLGAGVSRSGSVAGALELARRTGALVGTTVGGRTSLLDERWSLGVLGMMANPAARELVAAADVVLVLGVALDRYNSDTMTLGKNARLVRVDRRPPDALWSPHDDAVHVTGELPAVLTAIAQRLPANAREGGRTAENREILEREVARQRSLSQLRTEDGPNPWEVVEVLDQLLPGDAHVVVGIGHFWYFVTPYLRPEPDRTFEFACGFASIGQAIPVGVGASLAELDRPVVVIEGDGSAVMNVQELQAAVRHNADLLVIILDNRAYGSEYHKLAVADLDITASTFDDVPFDFVAVATAMGATARGADTTAELASALLELVPLRGVRLIAARISTSTMSEAYVRQHGPARPSHSAAPDGHAPTPYQPR